MFSFLLKQHIRQPAEFDAVFKQGKRFYKGCFTLIFLNTERDYPRLGILIGKRYCRLAVGRNRIKRLVRESFRRHQQALSGKDIVVMLRSPVEIVNNQEQREWLEQLFLQCAASASS